MLFVDIVLKELV